MSSELDDDLARLKVLLIKVYGLSVSSVSPPPTLPRLPVDIGHPPSSDIVVMLDQEIPQKMTPRPPNYLDDRRIIYRIASSPAPA